MSNNNQVTHYDNYSFPRGPNGEIIMTIDGGPKTPTPLPITSSYIDPNRIPLYAGFSQRDTPVFTMPPGLENHPRGGVVAYKPGSFATFVSLASIYKAKNDLDAKVKMAINNFPKDIEAVKSKAKAAIELLKTKEFKKNEPFVSELKKISDAISSLDKNIEKKAEIEKKINEQQKFVDIKLDEFLGDKLVKLKNFKKCIPNEAYVLDAAFGSVLSLFPGKKRPPAAILWDTKVMEPNDRLLDLKNNLITILNITNVTNNNIKIETTNLIESIKKEDSAIQDAVKFTADFYKETFKYYGDKAETLAKDLAKQAKGKNIRNVNGAF